MHDYLFDTELVRLTIVLGVVASLLFYQRFGVTTGGIIVPGYLALFVQNPTHIVATLLVTLLTYKIVQTQLRPRFMLWGRGLFETEILISLVFQILWAGIVTVMISTAPQLALLYGIGYLLPGIIAHDMGRQGVSATVLAACVCAYGVFGASMLAGSFRDLVAFSVSPMANVISAQAITYAYPKEWIAVAVVISVLANMALHRYGNPFKHTTSGETLSTGGFVTAAYLALIINRPLDLLFILCCSAITYVIVTKWLMPRVMLFGRTKVAAMFLTGMTVTWIAEILIAFSGVNYVPWLGFAAIAPVIATLLANGAQRRGLRPTLIGTSISTLVVFSVMTIITLFHR